MTKVLFVDDEPTIRLTLPKILEMHEFEVRAAANVQDALKLIQEEKFDVLLSDLNIGAPSDGFTVVSAMRRVQPDAVTIIITGYPAFESALQAIREQVDDYISKPANVDELVQTIKNKVQHRSHHALPLQVDTGESLATHRQEILQRYVSALRHSNLPVADLSDKELQNHVPVLLEHLIEDLRGPSRRPGEMKKVAAQHGRTRRSQGFSIIDLVEELRLLRNAICDSVQTSLLEINTSRLIPDMVSFGDFLLLCLRESMEAHLSENGPKPVHRAAKKAAAKTKPRVRRAS